MARIPRTVTVNGHRWPIVPTVVARNLVADVRAMPRGLKAWLGGLSLVLAAGAVAAVIALPPGWEVLGTSPAFEWGLLIAAYVCFAITTSGLCLASSLGTVFGIDRYRPLEKRHAILAVLCLTAAFGIIALDLHFPLRLVFGAVLSPSLTSAMWWMGAIYAFYLAVLLLEVWTIFWDRPALHRWVCALAACTAIVAPLTLGAVFALLIARPVWHDLLTPVLMVVSAFVAGTSLLAIVFVAVARLRLRGFERARQAALPGLRLLLGVALIVIAILVARSLAIGLLGGPRGLTEATAALTTGPLALQYWGLRIAAGLVLPLALIALPATRTEIGLLVAAICALCGVFVDRWLLVAAGQVAPVTASAGSVAAPYAGYTASPVEIAIVVAAVAFVAFGYTLAERYLDLGESEVHVGFSLGALGRGLRRAAARLHGRPPTPAGGAS